MFSQENALTWTVISSKNTISGDMIATCTPRLCGLNILIQTRDTSLLVAGLIFAEKSAKAIFIVPAAMTQENVEDLLGGVHIDILVSDTGSLSISDHKIESLGALIEFAGTGGDGSDIGATIETKWLIPTSGTTGAPKFVVHTLASLTGSMRAADDRKRPVPRWGLLYDHSRFAGLQVVLYALLAGDNLLAPDSSLSLGEKIAFLAQHQCTHISTTPTLWRKIMMSNDSGALELKQITLGGEAADKLVLQSLRAKFPDSKITHIYASTEAGVGFSVTDEKEGFPAAYLGVPHKDVVLQIIDGRLHIKNEKLEAKYLYGEEFRKNGWVDTGDLAEVVGDRVFIRGRENGLINVGGDKVLPSEVRRTLLSCPIVHDAHVFAKDNPITGSLIAADIVLKNRTMDHGTAKKDVTTHARANLLRFQVPRIIKFYDELNVNEAGKVMRH